MSRATFSVRLLGATLLAAGAALAPAVAAAADTPSAQQIIAAADRVRNPGEPFRSTVTLTEYVGGSERNHDRLVVFSKEDRSTHQFRNLIEYVDPPRDAGKKVLLDGHSLWFFDPASNISIRISAQQRLIGQAAIGDVLTVNLAIDYTATLTGAETIKDAARADRNCWHLDLKAANDQAVYAHVEYWVEQGTNFPVKGKFYSDSGRLLKILYYRSFATALGAVRPTEAVIIDAVDTSLATSAAFADYRDADIPDAWFQRDYLPRLQVK